MRSKVASMAASPSAAEWAARRQNMVESQLRTFDVTDLAVLGAFDTVPREAFVAPAAAASAYLDGEVPAAGPLKRMLLAPATLARLLQAAQVKRGEKALEIAGGSGYGAAIMTALGAEAVSLDADPAALKAAPFAIILVNGAFERRPEELLALLADGGRLVGVEAVSSAPKAVLIEKVGAAISRRVLFDANGARLDEFRRAPAFSF
jgi:protein-L-isoaspartate(D-aspartate) O-methyltransferase